MTRAAEVASKCLVKTNCGGEEKEKIVWKVAFVGPKRKSQRGRNLETTREGRREGEVRSDRRGAGRHLILTAQCPCYGQTYTTGCRTGRHTAL